MRAEKAGAAIRWEDEGILTDAPGSVDAERSVAPMGWDSFDYTEWRRDHLPQGSVLEISNEAAAHSEGL